MRERAGIDLRVVRGFPDYYFGKTTSGKREGRYLEAAPFEISQLGSPRKRFVDPAPLGGGLASSTDLVESGGDLVRLGNMIARHLERGERCGGAALSAAPLKAASDRDAVFRTEYRATRLLLDGDAVVGVEITGANEEPTPIRSQAVLLATGGYDWNSDLVRSFEHVGGLKSMAPSTVEGDHITLAGEVGAKLVSALPEATPSWSGSIYPDTRWTAIRRIRRSAVRARAPSSSTPKDADSPTNPSIPP